MSASSVSLFPDDADSAKTYLAVTQTALSNLWIRITTQLRDYDNLGKIVFHSDQEGLKEQFDVKTETEKYRATVPLKSDVKIYKVWLPFFPHLCSVYIY